MSRNTIRQKERVTLIKRIGHLYDKICDEDNIRLAIRNASKGKRDKLYVKNILRREDKVVREIVELLRSGDYKPKSNRTKTIREGSAKKTRFITIPMFYPDQIIHWAVMQVLEPIFMKSMYRYCCGSVPGRGGSDAKRYVERVCKKKKARYILKLDICKFFPSISHKKLKELLAKRIKDTETLNLLFVIIKYGGLGLPIGYYTSQWLANFYMQEIDHYIKETLRVPFYVRYVDDMVLIGPNKRALRKALWLLIRFLESEEYKLTIKGDWQLWKIYSRPLDFVGYRFYETHTKLRRHIFYKLMKIVRRVKDGGLNIGRSRRLVSLIGWCKQINFRKFYLEHIRPTVRMRNVRRYISNWVKRNNERKMMKPRGRILVGFGHHIICSYPAPYAL